MSFEYGPPSPTSVPLPATEEHALRERVAAEWGYDGSYWYPLAPHTRADLLALQAPYVRRAFAAGGFARLVQECGVASVLELREGRGAWRGPVHDFDPDYDGREAFFTDDTLGWAVYASHETSLTFGGSTLIATLKRMWPEWESRVWTTPFF